MLKKIKNLVVQEEGQALTEYGLILALIVALAVGVFAAFGPKLTKVFEDIADAISAKLP
ncbi:Flp family type IVb pilin [Neobacillus sp. NRS-1170]|uniref:Flp family type IVb pilin n=1 Tax=Neobacillus sp. NRS-1170 TaxID=3233898 RepID=UPI003D277959